MTREVVRHSVPQKSRDANRWIGQLGDPIDFGSFVSARAHMDGSWLRAILGLLRGHGNAPWMHRALTSADGQGVWGAKQADEDAADGFGWMWPS